MDWGQLIPAVAIAVGAVGTARHVWATRTPPQQPVVAARSHVRRVESCVESGTPETSLALDAYCDRMAGGTEIEAAIAAVERRHAEQGDAFSDRLLRRRGRDPRIVSAVESYLAHPSQQAADQ